MARHFIILVSAYSIGKRIALDYNSRSKLNLVRIKQDIEYIFNEYGKDAPISTHYIQTDNSSWQSVVDKDKFFEDVMPIQTKEEFVQILLKDKELKGIDIAKYILTQTPCTHLKLEKMVYMCYAEYLCETNERLFQDKIYAYRLGPVVKTVYEKYKKSGKSSLEAEDDVVTYDEKVKNMPLRSRILSSHNGVKKVISVDKIIEKYSKYTANELVELTHKKQTPWSVTEKNKIIKDKDILKYHINETI